MILNILFGNILKKFTNILGEYKRYYSLVQHKINLSNKEELIDKLNELKEKNIDAIVLTRGGGKLDIFNDVDIAESILSINKIPFISAIGHAVDSILTQEIADKKFTTPTALGTYLKEISKNTIENIRKKQEVKEKYEYIIKDYQENEEIIKNKSIIKKEEMGNKYEDMVKRYQGSEKILKNDLEKYKKQTILFLIIGIVIGIIINKFL